MGMREADIRPPQLFNRYLEILERDIHRFFGEPSQFVEVPCVGCGAEAAESAFEKLGFRYVTCRECKSLYVSPRPSAAMLGATLDDDRSSPAKLRSHPGSNLWRGEFVKPQLRGYIHADHHHVASGPADR